MADPTRLRTGLGGPHADYGPSILSTTSYCGEGLPSVVDEIVPLHMRGRAPTITDGAGKIHNDTIMSSLWRTPRRQRRRFFSPPGGRSEREDSIRPCEETGHCHRTAEGSGLPTARYCTMGRVHKIRPPSSHPYSGWRSRCRRSETKPPQTARNVQNWHQTIALVVFPSIALIFHGSLPIGIDGVGKR